MTALVESLHAAASSGGLVAVPLALAGGVVAGLNPSAASDGRRALVSYA